MKISGKHKIATLYCLMSYEIARFNELKRYFKKGRRSGLCRGFLTGAIGKIGSQEQNLFKNQEIIMENLRNGIFEIPKRDGRVNSEITCTIPTSPSFW